MAAIDDITAAIANVAAKIRDASVNPKPNYSLDGESYSWAEWFEMLTRQLTELKKAEGVLAAP